jgi:hypothetical protein
MTINVNTSRNEYTATSGQTVFNFTFKIYAATDLNVYVTPAGQECNDVTDLTEAYTVTGVGLEDGGSITLNTGAGANDLVTIVSAIPSSRTTDYQSNGDFTPETVNNDINRAISLIKQVESKANRSLLSSECLQGPKPLTLPKPEPGEFIRWKADVSGLENVPGSAIAEEVIVETDYAIAATAASAAAALVSEGNALTYRDAAQAAQAAAEAAQTAAETAYDNFDDRYLGSFTTAAEPTLDNDGAALLDGALYWNTTVPELRVYDLNTTTWVGISTGYQDKADIDALGIDADTVDGYEGVALKSGRKNYIINGNFDIWQRGTTVGDGSTVLNDEFLADRWLCNDGVGGNFILSQEVFTLGQTDVPDNPKYFHRLDFPTTAPSDAGYMSQYIESARTLSGKTATLTFYAKGTISGNITVDIVQNFGTGGSPSASVITAIDTITLTTSWVKHEFTIAIPSITGKTGGTDGNSYLQVRLQTPSSATGQLDIAQVQLEEGSVATDFEYRPIGEELALCQRYYEIIRGKRITGVTFTPNGDTRANLPFKTEKRETPTISQTGSLNVIGTGSNSSITNIGLGTISLASTTHTAYINNVSNYSAFAGTGSVMSWGDNGGGNWTVYADAEL